MGFPVTESEEQIVRPVIESLIEVLQSGADAKCGYCALCEHWRKDHRNTAGMCVYLADGYPWAQSDPRQMTTIMAVGRDGFWSQEKWLWTKPEFGCVRFERRSGELIVW